MKTVTVSADALRQILEAFSSGQPHHVLELQALVGNVITLDPVSTLLYEFNAAVEAYNNPRPQTTLADEDVIEQVETEIGMGHGAWDMVSPADLVQAFRNALKAHQ